MRRVGRRFDRDKPVTVAASGLSGDVDIPDPIAVKEPGDLKSRAKRFRQAIVGTARGMPRVFRLAWAASPWLTVAMAVSTLLTALVPTATAYSAKLLMDAVVEAFQIHTQNLPDQATLSVPFVGITLALSSTMKIVALASAQFLIYVVNAVGGAIGRIGQLLLQERMSLTIRHQVMTHATTLDLVFFEGSESYDLMRQVQQEAPNRPLSMLSGAFGLLKTIITFASMIALLVAVSPLLAAIALLSPIPAFISESKFSGRAFMLANWSSPIRRRMDYLSTLVTTDAPAKEVKLFGLGGYLSKRFRLLGEVYYDRQRKLVRTRTIRGVGWSLLTTLVGSGIYLYIALEAVAGRLTIGDLALYTAAANSVQSSVSGLFTGFTGMYENNLYLDQLYRFLATPAAIAAPARPRPLPVPLRGEVRFEDVTFRYPGAEEPAVDRVSFTISPGETIAVVGRNGAGKSTLMKLLCRLYDPTEGRILLDGIDVREFDPAELRTTMSAMFQDYVTYQATVAENVGLGDLSNLDNREAVESAVRQSGAAERIDRMPDGLDSTLGRWFDKGVNLSGGEWQKIALGRAFMRNSTILVLDEPTSALDAEAEHELFGRLRELAEGRTTLYISHRFSTVRQADRILFLRDGSLIEEGTHAELMALGGDYESLFTLQAAAYVDAPPALDVPRARSNGFAGDRKGSRV